MFEKVLIVIGRVALTLLGFSLLLGCQQRGEPKASVRQNANDGHGQHTQHKTDEPARLVLKTTPVTIRAGTPIKIAATLHDATDSKLSSFEPTHEKLGHLIVVRQGLDEFAHLHPEVSEDGTFSTVFNFPIAGIYRVFLDYKELGKSPSTARAEIIVSGDAPAAPRLVGNVPGNIEADGLKAFVSQKGSGNFERVLSFALSDEQNRPIEDLEPYLGAMGHLVVLSEDGTQYVHAHPRPQNDVKNIVEFEVHFPGPGLYKGWGQFQRQGKVVTIPAVIDIAGQK